MNRKDARRMAYGLRWETERPPLPPTLHMRFLDAAYIIVGLLLFLFVLGVVQAADDAAALEEQQAKTKHFTSQLSACLNGGTLWDKASNTAIFCEKPILVRNP